MSNYHIFGLVTEQWEIIYYVAFIVLTIGLFFFAAKTYFFQTKQTVKLFCKSIERHAASGNSNLYIEVYNSGNAVAENVKVKIQGVEFGTIPFLKPGEDYLIPVAYFLHVSDTKIVLSDKIELNDDATTVTVELTTEKSTETFAVDISMQKNSRKLNESDSRYLEKIAKTLDDIEKKEEKIAAEIKNMSKVIEKKK